VRTKLCVMVIFAFSLGFVGCKSPEEKEADKKFVDGEQAKLQGTWKIASREGTEDADVEVDGAGLEIVIKDDVLQHVSNGKVQTRQKMTIIPKTDPVQVDLVYLDEDGKPLKTSSAKKVKFGKKKDKTKVTTKEQKYRGIYKLDGDKLKIAWNWDDSKRPTDVTSAPGVYVLSLVKAKEGKEEKKADKAPEKKADKEGKEEKKADKAPEKDKADKTKEKKEEK